MVEVDPIILIVIFSLISGLIGAGAFAFANSSNRTQASGSSTSKSKVKKAKAKKRYTVDDSSANELSEGEEITMKSEVRTSQRKEKEPVEVPPAAEQPKVAKKKEARAPRQVVPVIVEDLKPVATPTKIKNMKAAKTAPPPPQEPEDEETEDDIDTNDDEELELEPVPEPEPEPEPEPIVVSKKKKKETPEQRAARAERQKAAKTKGTTLAEESKNATTTVEESSKSAHVESSSNGWAVAGEKKQIKKAKKTAEQEAAEAATAEALEAEAEAAAAAANAIAEAAALEDAVDFVTKSITVETRKIGLIIGPKGVTKLRLQNITGAEITMPPGERGSSNAIMSEIKVSGTAEATDIVLAAINELMKKGYATILAPPGFTESTVEVHPRFMATIMGKGGVCVKNIQTATGVRISTPNNSGSKLNSDGSPITKVSVGLAGLEAQVEVARKTILELCKYFHTEISHPGYVHQEMMTLPTYYNYIIGSKGSEIKTIQSRYEVSVHIPNEETYCKNVLVVGLPSNVTRAAQHIQKIVDKVDQIAADRVAAEAAELAKWGPGATAVVKAPSINDVAPLGIDLSQSTNADILGSTVPLSV